MPGTARILWQGEWEDGTLTLFCDHDDEDVKVLFFDVQSIGIKFSGNIIFTPDVS
jgi:hypothetical protein